MNVRIKSKTAQPDLFVDTNALKKIKREIYFRKLWLKEFEFNSRKNRIKYDENFKLEDLFRGNSSKHLEIPSHFKKTISEKLIKMSQSKTEPPEANTANKHEILTIEDFLNIYKNQYTRYKILQNKIKDKEKFVQEIEEIKTLYLKKHADNITKMSLSTDRDKLSRREETQQQLSDGLDFMVSKYTHKQALKAIANMSTIPARPLSSKRLLTNPNSSRPRSALKFYKSGANFDVAFDTLLEKERKKGELKIERKTASQNPMKLHLNIQKKNKQNRQNFEIKFPKTLQVIAYQCLRAGSLITKNKKNFSNKLKTSLETNKFL